MAKTKQLPSLMPALYSHRLREIQEVAKAAGYAIAVHGSMQRDLDLIAVPWVEDCAEGGELVDALCEKLHLTTLPKDPQVNPHGRYTYTLLMGGACFMDLSVIAPML